MFSPAALRLLALVYIVIPITLAFLSGAGIVWLLA